MAIDNKKMIWTLVLAAALLAGGAEITFCAGVQDVLKSRMAEESQALHPEENGAEETVTAESTPEAGEGKAPAGLPVVKTDRAEEESGSAAEKILDLSSMSVVMSYAEMTRMLANPSEYEGQAVKTAGTFYALGQGPEDRQNYCSMYDGCCTYCDVRFLPENTNLDPASYLQDGQWVTVTGTFGLIEVMGRPVYGLFNAKIN